MDKKLFNKIVKLITRLDTLLENQLRGGNSDSASSQPTPSLITYL